MTQKTKNDSSNWDKIYDEQSPNNIVWNFEEIPEWFDQIIKSGWVKPCKTLDIGCGLGNYANYLATNNFDVLGIDFSKSVIKRDNKKFNKENLKFEVCEALNIGSLVNKNNSEKFEFVVDISLFHYIKPEERKKYADSISNITKKDAKVLICCFSENDPVFDDKKVFLNPDINMPTYVLSKKDIIEAFEEKFKIKEISEIEFGKLSKIGDSLTRKRHLVKLIRK